MRFNKFLTATFLSAIAIGSIGCEKVLNEAPYNAFTDESIFTTPERATLALNGVYDAAQTGDVLTVTALLNELREESLRRAAYQFIYTKSESNEIHP